MYTLGHSSIHIKTSLQFTWMSWMFLLYSFQNTPKRITFFFIFLSIAPNLLYIMASIFYPELLQEPNFESSSICLEVRRWVVYLNMILQTFYLFRYFLLPTLKCIISHQYPNHQGPFLKKVVLDYFTWRIREGWEILELSWVDSMYTW